MFIAAVTMTSRGEVHGIAKNNLRIALILFFVVSAILFFYRIMPAFHLSHAFIFILLFSGCTVLPLVNAIRNPSAEKIRTAVQYGILSLILMNASLVAGFAGIEYGIAVACLLPVSIFLSRIFAVT